MSAPYVAPITRILATIRGLPVSGRRGQTLVQTNTCTGTSQTVKNIAVPDAEANSVGTTTCSASLVSTGAVGYTAQEILDNYNTFFADHATDLATMNAYLTVAAKRGVLFKGGCVLNQQTQLAEQTYFINNSMMSFNPSNSAYLASCPSFGGAFGLGSGCRSVCDSDNPGQYGVSGSFSSGSAYNGSSGGPIGSSSCVGCGSFNTNFV